MESTVLVSALGAAFDEAIDLFESIEVIGTYGWDYQTAILRFDIAKRQLARWGKSTGLNRRRASDQIRHAFYGTVSDQKRAKKLLDHLNASGSCAQHHMEDLRSESSLSSDGQDIELRGRPPLDSVVATLHELLEDSYVCTGASGRACTRQKWVIYEEVIISNLLTDFSETIHQLQQLFPLSYAERHRMCVEESMDLVYRADTTLLTHILRQQDVELGKEVRERIDWPFYPLHQQSMLFGTKRSDPLLIARLGVSTRSSLNSLPW